jgi:hypothetical protein
MSLSLDEIRTACTAAEYAIVLASRSPSIEKLSLAELKKHAANARKLSDKWQKLSRGQSRTQSKATGSPNLDSKSYTKQQAFHEALGAFETQMAKMSSVATVQPASAKPSAAKRTAGARVARQSTRKELHLEKKAINKTATAKAVAAPAASKPAAPAAAPAVKRTKAKPATKKAATKGTVTKTVAAKDKLVKAAAKRAAKRPTATSAAAAPKATKTTTKKGIVRPTAAASATLAGKAKANRVALSNKSSNIAGHVSGKGKRVQAKRDSKGR